MQRRELIQLGASILGTLGIPSAFDRSNSVVAAAGTNSLDETYLAKGLTGMARADGWFGAHWGAAVIAGYYLCKDNPLAEETVSAIRDQLDAMMELQASQFMPFPEVSAQIERIPDILHALPPAMKGGLRAHGHAVIFASLATRALHEAPHLAHPIVIERICGLSGQIAKLKSEKPTGEKSYADVQEMIEATFDSFVRFEGLLGRPSVKRPNFTHITTHTEALMNLENMGYHDLVKQGYLGHRAHIQSPVPVFDSSEHPLIENTATLNDSMNKEYWQREENIARWNKQWNVNENPNGYWVAFGHLFKVLYAYHRLVQRIDDKNKVRLCSQIVLERYFNPLVQGG